MAAMQNYGQDSLQCAGFVLDKKLGKYVKKIWLLLFPAVLVFIRAGSEEEDGGALMLTIGQIAGESSQGFFCCRTEIERTHKIRAQICYCGKYL
ncbi:hypothetical protein GJ700_15270 [Duganella sp. FT92W]|uniref:Uncharacterized protein n=1 Tax=Pseudoduganella rivuli TaxID=2666085 RepID=A0A7X2LTJ9_9BURK|nr:hypothetical protein [Pseudoduganella rivuli]MRV73068.1 hypothetical protein [Pseudoduganella rivuli]